MGKEGRESRKAQSRSSERVWTTGLEGESREWGEVKEQR